MRPNTHPFSFGMGSWTHSIAKVAGSPICMQANAKLTGDLRQEPAQRADAARRPCRTKCYVARASPVSLRQVNQNALAETAPAPAIEIMCPKP
jgi:hypothetical protein